MAYGETQQKTTTLKDVYQARQEKKAADTQAVTPVTKPTIGVGAQIRQPLPVAVSSFPKIIAPSKAKEFALHKGSPDGVPPGASRMVPAWDYDPNTGKFLVGQDKERKRQSLWDRYRSIQQKRGVKASPLVKQTVSRPSVASSKYGG
ncbi:uncharacterized protein METZ01_LOCUS348766 [marine metagenome]|uniref:Uncharacterized protein n=1 Tax=marine metagenome TaxID=408172 RepID=A0A382RF94_9ZZZZ